MSTVPPLPSLEHSFEPFKFDAAPLQKFMRAVWDKASDSFSACINWLALNSEPDALAQTRVHIGVAVHPHT